MSGGLQESYSYDAWGNLSQSGNYSFQPTQWTVGNQVADSGYSYDLAGNMTTELIPGVGSRSYSYNSFNQLTSSGSVTYTYDVEGNRIRVDGTADGPTEYIYISGRLLAAYNVNAGTWTDMIYAGNQFIAEVAGTQSAVPNYRLADHLGSLAVLTDNSGNQLGTWDYTPYGQVLSHSGTDDAYLFSGLPWDGDTNSSHAGARQLMAVEGRWLTPDSYRGSYDFSNPQSFNRYMYVNGVPMWATDPTGMDGGCTPTGSIPGAVADCGVSVVLNAIGTSAAWIPVVGWALDIGMAINELGHFFGWWGHPAFHGNVKASQTGKNVPKNKVCSESDQQIVRDASVKALSHLNPSQDEANNITPLNFNFAKVVNPSAVSTQGWTPELSLHGSGIESRIIPGQKTFVVKMYSDPRLGYTIAVVYPTMSFMHFVQAPLYEAGVHVNAANARSYMGCR